MHHRNASRRTPRTPHIAHLQGIPIDMLPRFRPGNAGERSDGGTPASGRIAYGEECAESAIRDAREQLSWAVCASRNKNLPQGRNGQRDGPGCVATGIAHLPPARSMPPSSVALARTGIPARELAARAGPARASMSLDFHSHVLVAMTTSGVRGPRRISKWSPRGVAPLLGRRQVVSHSRRPSPPAA